MQINRTRTGQGFTHQKIMKGACEEAKWQLCRGESCSSQLEGPRGRVMVVSVGVIWVIPSTPERFVLPSDEWKDVKPCW